MNPTQKRFSLNHAASKSKFLSVTIWIGAFLYAASFQLPAQQSGAGGKLPGELREKAEKGDAKAQYDVGAALLVGESGLAKDEVEAVKWLRKAAAQNHAEAQLNLGVCYEAGRGVGKNAVEALKWFRKAAEQNHPHAQANLGVCYASGQGVAMDEAEAVKWFRKAAEQNFAGAQYNLGDCYFHGRGMAKDVVEGVKWFHKAAEQNFAGAQYNLGRCYALGHGVTKDVVEAYAWFGLAGGTLRWATENQDRLAAREMSPEQLLAGLRRTRELRAQIQAKMIKVTVP